MIFSLLKKLFGPGTDFNALLAQGALIVDVRTPQEYREGHIPQSQNIPLDQLKNKIADLKKKNKPIITVCRSGSRSGMAKSMLSQAGIEVYNGGPWTSLGRKMLGE